MNVHSIIPQSRANGPGRRLVVWFAGCSLGCPGCINPHLWPKGSGHPMTIEEVLAHVTTEEGLTVSGGEPFQQPEALADLLEAARGRGLTTMAYSGYSLEELEAPAHRGRLMPVFVAELNSAGLSMNHAADYRRALAALDLLVHGRYMATLRSRDAIPLISSHNQEVAFLTDRYSSKDLRLISPVEVVVDIETGKTVATGHR